MLRLEFEELRIPRPDVTVVLDIPPEVSRDRVVSRDGDGDVYERSFALQSRVREGYLAAAAVLADVVVVPALGTPAEVHELVVRAVRP